MYEMMFVFVRPPLWWIEKMPQTLFSQKEQRRLNDSRGKVLVDPKCFTSAVSHSLLLGWPQGDEQMLFSPLLKPDTVSRC